MSKATNESRRKLMERMNTEGIEAAYVALLDVCLDKKAPAPARATAATSMFRGAGLFDHKDGSSGSREGHEMSGEELAEAIDKIEQELKGGEAPSIFK